LSYHDLLQPTGIIREEVGGNVGGRNGVSRIPIKMQICNLQSARARHRCGRDPASL
jgi:hypothetical protein